MPANLDRTASKLPIDTDVVLPPSIAKAGADADALHRAAYPPAAPDPPAVVPPAQPDPPAASAEPPVPEPPAPTPPADPPAPVEPPVQPSRAELQESEWARRYNAMKGRWEQATQSNGMLQEQLQEMGDELMRSQAARTAPREQPPAPRATVKRHVTEDDVKTYGPELIDTIQRAARDAIAPELETVQNQTRQVSQRVAKTSRMGTLDAITREVPDWETINNSPRFKQWCRLPDVYSGQVRANLLNAAFQAADAPRVVAFFKGFLAEEVATGQIQPPQPPAAPVAPRAAAVPLETLTAPGRPKPAGGQAPPNAADKPVITRAQISTFYKNVREGHYSGRDADKARDEAVIFAAQNEGRIRG